MATFTKIRKQLQSLAKSSPNSRAQELVDYMDNGHTDFRKGVEQSKKQHTLQPIPRVLQSYIVRDLKQGVICPARIWEDLLEDSGWTDGSWKVPNFVFDDQTILYKMDTEYNMLIIATTQQQLDSLFAGDLADFYGSGKSAIRKFRKAHLKQAKDKYGYSEYNVLFLGV